MGVIWNGLWICSKYVGMPEKLASGLCVTTRLQARLTEFQVNNILYAGMTTVK